MPLLTYAHQIDVAKYTAFCGKQYGNLKLALISSSQHYNWWPGRRAWDGQHLPLYKTLFTPSTLSPVPAPSWKFAHKLSCPSAPGLLAPSPPCHSLTADIQEFQYLSLIFLSLFFRSKRSGRKGGYQQLPRWNNTEYCTSLVGYLIYTAFVSCHVLVLNFSWYDNCKVQTTSHKEKMASDTWQEATDRGKWQLTSYKW